ncbi:MAG: hypothetical protein IJW18_07965 [Lachnospiraceae bacterium]|nr:hypothetical protein [Lachnospiraceae bacterium]
MGRLKRVLVIVLSLVFVLAAQIHVFAKTEDEYLKEKNEKIETLEAQIEALETELSQYDGMVLNDEQAKHFEDLSFEINKLEERLRSLQMDTSSDEFMKKAKSLAKKEWIKYLWIVIPAVVVLVVITYYNFSKSIWAARTNRKIKKTERLKVMQHVVAVFWLVAGTGFLLGMWLYMRPQNIKHNYDAYGINHIGGDWEGKEDCQETSYIVLDIVVRKTPFKDVSVTGTIVADGIHYWNTYGAVAEHDDKYYFSFIEEGAGFLDISRTIHVTATKDFEVYEYQGVNHESNEIFVAPASTKEAARVACTKLYGETFNRAE